MVGAALIEAGAGMVDILSSGYGRFPEVAQGNNQRLQRPSRDAVRYMFVRSAREEVFIRDLPGLVTHPRLAVAITLDADLAVLKQGTS
jgi:hypothetical protein